MFQTKPPTSNVIPISPFGAPMGHSSFVHMAHKTPCAHLCFPGPTMEVLDSKASGGWTRFSRQAQILKRMVPSCLLRSLKELSITYNLQLITYNLDLITSNYILNLSQFTLRIYWSIFIVPFIQFWNLKQSPVAHDLGKSTLILPMMAKTGAIST